MKNILKYFLTLFLVLIVFLQSNAQEYIVNNVHVISMQNDKVLKDQFIHIKGDKIVGIFPKKDLSKFEKMEKIDGKGAYAFPGLKASPDEIPCYLDAA